MFKGKVAILSLMSAAVLLVAGVAFGGIIDPCQSTASSAGGCLLICPAGDGAQMSAVGATISITVNDGAGVGIEGIPGSDAWVIDCDPSNDMVLCGGSGSSNADEASDASGNMTMSGDIAGGGCADGLTVIVQGFAIGCPAICLNTILVRSPDMNGDLVVNLIDFGSFGGQYPPNPLTNPCADFNCDGIINLQDFSAFGIHYTHECG